MREALRRLEKHWQENSLVEKEEKSFAEKVSAALDAFVHEMISALSMLVEMLYWGTIGLVFRRNFRRGVLWEQMYQLGYKATGIVMSLSFLIGIAVAAQSIIQLDKFGASIYTVSMVVMGMVRELGPLMVAIIFAGRTGSAITAEIATMSVQEEVDALKTMGLNEIQFIVVPKFWAATLTIPFLTILGTSLGILGGGIISYVMGGQSIYFIFNEFQKALILRDIIISLIKSFVFAWLVVWVGAYYGFTVKGGADEVGRKTTSSVVTSLFVIIIADALFSFVYELF
ncbi:MAG: MlaE family ABC transporter permease [Fibrobacterota bacterium]